MNVVPRIYPVLTLLRRVVVVTGGGRIFCAGADLIACVVEILDLRNTKRSHLGNDHTLGGTNARRTARQMKTRPVSFVKQTASHPSRVVSQLPSPSLPLSTGARMVAEWKLY